MATAGIVLVRPSLAAAVNALRLSRVTMRTIRQNLFWAFAYNVLAIPLAACGLLSPTLAAQMAACVDWPPFSRTQIDSEVDRGSLYVGSPETVARKIAATARALSLSRFDLKYSAGPLPHPKLMHCIGLYGTKVIPLVRDMLAS